ncbi:hypothetical protein ACFLRC_03445 [Candidatus Altiarchaeota archaeon]
MIEKIDYRKAIFIPPVLSLIMVIIIFFNGIPLSIDFQGGSWVDVSLDERLTDQETEEMVEKLSEEGFSEVRAQWGWDPSAGKYKLSISTSTEANSEDMIEYLQPLLGILSEYDKATFKAEERIPSETLERLRQRFPGSDVSQADDTVIIRSLDLDVEEVERAARSYIGEDAEVSIEHRNFNLRSVGPTLGTRFKEQGIKALLVAFLFMAIVIFIAFREFIPSIAVMSAATCDIIIALGGMSLFGLQMEPASLAALLMLIGYSVDSDILLTARVMKRRGVEVNERIDNAMTTGLTMTGTTLAALTVVRVVSIYIIPIETLATISAVLLMGLFADLATTWLMNAGMLKWYIELPRKKKRRFA